MRNRLADEFERSLRSEGCTDGTHDDCPHMHGFAAGLNPRRLRLEWGATLCKCECHSSCPITSKRMTVREQTWIESCTCPGAEDERPRVEQPSARRKAFVAVQARVAGMSPEQIKDLYKAELRARGVDIPPEVLLDTEVSLIASDYRAAMRSFGQSLAELLGSVFRPPR